MFPENRISWESPGPLDYFEHPTTTDEMVALVPGAVPIDQYKHVTDYKRELDRMFAALESNDRA